MKRSPLSPLLVVVLLSLSGVAPSPQDEPIKKLTEVIQKYCPEAKIETKDDRWIAKHGTMIFTMHSRSMTGEISADTYKTEGPNYKGFMVTAWLEDADSPRQVALPQTFNELYFNTYGAIFPAATPKKICRVNFSYGSRLDPEFKKALMDVLAPPPPATRPDDAKAPSAKP